MYPGLCRFIPILIMCACSRSAGDRPTEIYLKTDFYDAINILALSPDRSTLAAGDADGNVRLWDIATGEARRTLSGAGGAVRSLAFSPDGRHLATGGWDKTVRLWDTASGRLVRAYTGHHYMVQSVTFTGDGAAILSRGIDGIHHLWDVATGEDLLTLVGFNNGSWVGHTAESRYYTPPEGEAFIQWRVRGEKIRDAALDTRYRRHADVAARLTGR